MKQSQINNTKTKLPQNNQQTKTLYNIQPPLKPDNTKHTKLLKSQFLQVTNISRMNIKINMFKLNLIPTRLAPIKTTDGATISFSNSWTTHTNKINSKKKYNNTNNQRKNETTTTKTKHHIRKLSK